MRKTLHATYRDYWGWFAAGRRTAAEAGAGAQDLAVVITQLERLAGLT
jgi:hypothetical protein